MKRIFLSLSLLMTVAVTATFAGPVSEAALKSFKKEFAGVQSVQWTDLGEYYKASFVLGESRVEACFSTDGELLGCARNLFYNQLPLAVMTAIDRKFTDATILDVKEINNSAGTNYSVSLEFNKRKYQIKADSGGSLEVVEKIKL